MRSLKYLIAVLTALTLSGCLEHHVTISLNKDGSGTVTEETTFGAQAIGMMSQMAAMGGDQATDPLADMVDEGKAAERAATMGEGVTVAKVETVDEGGRKGGRVIYAFEDINDLKLTFGDSISEMGDGMKPPGVEGEEPPENEPMTFKYADGVLTFENPNIGNEAGAADDQVEAEEEFDEAGLAMVKQMMGDMKMSMVLEIPGGIEETNASYVDGNAITFMDMEMSKLLEDPEKFKTFASAQPETPAAMQEALKGIDGVKIETEEKVTVKLK